MQSFFIANKHNALDMFIARSLLPNFNIASLPPCKSVIHYLSFLNVHQNRTSLVGIFIYSFLQVKRIFCVIHNWLLEIVFLITLQCFLGIPQLCIFLNETNISFFVHRDDKYSLALRETTVARGSHHLLSDATVRLVSQARRRFYLNIS